MEIIPDMIIDTKTEAFQNAPEIVWCKFYKPDNSFLLLKRHSDKPEWSTWWDPGGKVESWETIEEAIIRETQEETGILLSKDSIEYVKTFYIIRERDNKHLIYHLFCTEYPNTSITLNDEHTEYGWFDRETALTLPLIHDEEPCIEAFLQYRNNL